MKLYKKLILVFLFASVIPLSISSVYTYYQSKQFFLEQAAEDIEDISYQRKLKVERVFSYYFDAFNYISNRSVLLNLINSYYESGSYDEEKMGLVLNEALEEFTTINIFDESGSVITTTKDNYDVLTFSKEAYEFHKKINNHRIDLNEAGDIVLIIEAELNTQQPSYLVAEVLADDLIAVLADRTGLGETGETYLVTDEDGENVHYVSPRRFIGDFDRELIPKDESPTLIKQALNKHEGFLPNVVDYRNERVLAYTRYLHVADWALITKMDHDEIFYTSESYIFQALIQNTVISLLVLIGGFFVAQSIVAPINRLVYSARQLEKGNFDFRLKVKSKNELGVLERALNRVAEALDIQVKKSQKQHLKLVSTIEHLPLGFILVDEDGRVELNNARIERVLGLERDLITLANINTFFDNDINIHEVIEDVKREKTVRIIKDLVSKEGRYYRIFVSPIEQMEKNDFIGFIILLEDITEEKELDKSRDEFFAVASHELRTPLTVIRGNASIIQDYFSKKVKDKKIKEMLQDIDTSCVRLIHVVQDFLDVSRLEQNQVQYTIEEFDLVASIEETINEMQSRAKEEKVKIGISDTPPEKLTVKADPGRVKQILVNLIGNAIKFAPKGDIKIAIIIEDTRAKISVIDNGQGIEEDRQKYLFKKFTQLGDDPITRDASKGTGLGLYISKMIAINMDCSLYLESSKVGKGSTFVLEVPLA